MKPTRVVVNGALGKVGREVVNALCREPETQIVGAVDLKITENYLALPDGSGKYLPLLTWALFSLPASLMCWWISPLLQLPCRQHV